MLTGENPGPLVELKFWSARCADLESIVDQVTVHAHICLRKLWLVRKIRISLGIEPYITSTIGPKMDF